MSVDPLFSLMKSNAYLSFSVSNTLMKTLKLKLNPLLVIYIKGFITAVEAYESNAIIFMNKRLSF